MIKRPAIFFDRDNTLIANDGYLGDPAGVRLIPDAADAVARARAMGYVVVTCSNQSGVARGMFSEDDVRAVNRRMDELLKTENPGASIDRHEFCPYHPEAKVDAYRQDSPLRKPSPGMIHRAAIALDLDTPKSWVVGDAPRDVEAGRAAGCRTVLVLDPTLAKSPAAEEKSSVRPDFVVGSLKEALDVIERERVRRPGASPPSDLGRSPSDVQRSPAPDVERRTPDVQRPTSNRDAAAPDVAIVDMARLESLATQILQEIKRRNEREHSDFSVPKLLAGILQVVVLALLFVAYLGHQNSDMLQTLLLFAIVLQTMVASLLLMSNR